MLPTKKCNAPRSPERMNDERARQALLSVADSYDRFAKSAAMGSLYERAVSRVIDEMEKS